MSGEKTTLTNTDRTDQPPSTAETQPSHRLLHEFLNSAGLSGVQQPYNGIAQLANRAAGREVISPMHRFDNEGTVTIGSPEWLARTAGTAAGMLPLFLGTRQLVRAGMSPLTNVVTADSVSLLGLRMGTEAYAVGQMAATGALYGGLFQPGDENHLLTSRLGNAFSTGATFGSMRWLGGKLPAYETDMSAPLATRLGQRLVTGAGAGLLSGGFGGLVNAETTAWTHGEAFAHKDQLSNAIATFATLGAVVGGADGARSEYVAGKSNANLSEYTSNKNDDARGNSELAMDDPMNQAKTLHQTGKELLASRNYSGATDNLRQATEAWSQTLGPDHPQVATGYADLANAFFRMGPDGHANAKTAIDQALTIREKAFGAESNEVASTLREKSAIEAAAGNYSEGGDSLSRAIQIWNSNSQKGAMSKDDLREYRDLKPSLYRRAIDMYELAKRPDQAETLRQSAPPEASPPGPQIGR